MDHHEWLHCNVCMRMSPSSVAFKLTSCGHIYCDRCLSRYSNKVCWVCKNQNFGTISLASKMKPDVQAFFANPVDLLKRNNSQVMKVMDFQNFHTQKLITYYKDSMKKVTAMCKKMNAECSAWKREQEGWRTRVEELMHRNESLSSENEQLKIALQRNVSRPTSSVSLSNQGYSDEEVPIVKHMRQGGRVLVKEDPSVGLDALMQHQVLVKENPSVGLDALMQHQGEPAQVTAGHFVAIANRLNGMSPSSASSPVASVLSVGSGPNTETSKQTNNYPRITPGRLTLRKTPPITPQSEIQINEITSKLFPSQRPQTVNIVHKPPSTRPTYNWPKRSRNGRHSSHHS